MSHINEQIPTRESQLSHFPKKYEKDWVHSKDNQNSLNCYSTMSLQNIFSKTQKKKDGKSNV